MPDHRKMDLDAVRAAPGVVAVLTARTSPASTTSAPSRATIRSLPRALVEYAGQSLFAVAAETIDAGARRRGELAEIDYEDLRAVITIDQAMAEQSLHPAAPRHDASATRRSAEKPGAAPPAPGRIEIGGQDHFYLEGQIALAVPGRGPTTSWSIPRPSIRARCSTTWQRCSACRTTRSPSRSGAWAAASAARRARPR